MASPPQDPIHCIVKWTKSLSICALMLAPLSACTTIIHSATSSLADSLSKAILNQDDPAIVSSGAPAYLLLIDGLIEDSPQDEKLLAAGARLYAIYAAVFVEDAIRAQRLSTRARNYGHRALCIRQQELCEAVEGHFHDFSSQLGELEPADVRAAYAFALAWGAWIQVHSSDWRALGDIPKVEALLERLLELNETFDRGGIHLLLGLIATRSSEELGGRPEQGRKHYERAIEISDGRNLMIKVRYAATYARLVFDRPLHDQLLREVLNADPNEPGLTLVNTLAKEEARALLQDADDYF